MNSNLHKAKSAKNDEFYTRYEDISNELKYYRKHFKGKVVLCNADDPRESNFFKFFTNNFEKLELKKVIATCYKSQDVDLFSDKTSEKAVYQIYEGDKNGNRRPDPEEIAIRELNGDGDFRSPEVIELLKEADIVVTNPPFSLFREFIAQLEEYNKKFLIVGSMNAITYKETFKLIKLNKLWLGMNNLKEFITPEGDIKKFGNINWYTNLDHKKRNEEVVLYKHYSPEEYPTYDNYEAINVDKFMETPIDFDGVMGVPISFLGKYNPKQFEIVTMSTMSGVSANHWTYINGKPKYARIYIKRK